MSITVKDVAKKAGVATSTVSRVINNHPSISEATRKKVRKVMDELGYVPNIAAQNLGKRTVSSIGVVLPPLNSKERLGNPFFLEILNAINNEARQAKMTVSIATAQDFPALLDNVKQMHLQKQVGGFILVYSDENDPIITYLYENKIPFTLIGHPYDHEDTIVYVDNDNQLLGKQATDYLIENDHRSILFLTNTSHENLFFERYFGYQKAMMRNGLSAHQAVLFEEAPDYVAFKDVLAKTKATAAVVIDDIFALRILQLLQLLDYQVPEDFSLISFNNSIYATLTHPYLTSIDIEVAALGQLATQKLLALIHNQTTAGMQIVVPHQLIKRETVVAPFL